MDKTSKKLNHIWIELKEFKESLKGALAPVEKATQDQTAKIIEQGKKTRKAIKDAKTEVKIDNKPIKDLHDTIKGGIDANVTFPEKQAVEGEVSLDEQTTKTISEALKGYSKADADRIIKAIKDNKTIVEKQEITQPLEIFGKVDISSPKPPDEYLPTRLSNGTEFIDLEKLLKDVAEAAAKKAVVSVNGGSGGTVYGTDINGGGDKVISVVESTDSPGVFGLVVLNADGSALSAGGSSPSSTYGSAVYGTSTYV